MIETTLHRRDDPQQDPSSGVARLDAFLNARLVAATTIDDGRHWWAVKVQAKRQLAETPSANVDALAAAMLRSLLIQEAA